ncbi:phosphoribosyltransferase family protein [Halomarina halobia]|uniref:Phosphoribosyltransferase family protein n=1 Tax=Halomarina halobia TaxID=3033386 RepID=A0ABD6A859_9EURY|nr:phosphoribosyltransferase family protein [Halomarina sp. PSR21]
MDYAYYYERMNTEAVGRYDVTPLFADGDVFANLVSDLLDPFADDYTRVVGIEALGFVLGGAAACEAGVGFVPVRKGGKLPLRDDEMLRCEVTDYSGEGKTLELAAGALDGGDRVLVVDDWVETGAQMRAACDLVESADGEIAGISVLRAHRDERTRDLFERYDVYSLG